MSLFDFFDDRSPDVSIIVANSRYSAKGKKKLDYNTLICRRNSAEMQRRDQRTLNGSATDVIGNDAKIRHMQQATMHSVFAREWIRRYWRLNQIDCLTRKLIEHWTFKCTLQVAINFNWQATQEETEQRTKCRRIQSLSEKMTSVMIIEPVTNKQIHAFFCEVPILS